MKLSSPPVFTLIAAVSLIFFVSMTGALAGVEIDIRAETGEKIRGTGKSGILQGSFGAPSINDASAVAYVTVLYGDPIGATNNNAIIFVRKGKNQKAYVTVQAGQPLSDSFLPGFNDEKTFALAGSGRVFRFGRDVAINKANEIGFVGEYIFTRQTVSLTDAGAVKDRTNVDESRTAFGTTARVKNNKFVNHSAVVYKSFNDAQLQTVLSISRIGGIAYDGIFELTPEREVPGFAFAAPPSPKNAYYYGILPTTLFDNTSFLFPLKKGKLVATTESNVIGLPLFTTFDRFSTPVIADREVCFIVADIADTGDEFDGIWQGSNPNLIPVVVKDTSAPGGGKFASFGELIGPSRRGNFVAFTANTIGGSPNGTGQGVFLSNLDGSNVVRIATTGKEVPQNTGVEGTFNSFARAGSNNKGEVAVLATLTVAGANQSVDGVFVTGKSGKGLRMIVVAGQEIDVRGEMKRITRIAFNPMAGINNRGEVAFTASFSDRTSAVVIASVR